MSGLLNWNSIPSGLNFIPFSAGNPEDGGAGRLVRESVEFSSLSLSFQQHTQINRDGDTLDIWRNLELEIRTFSMSAVYGGEQRDVAKNFFGRMDRMANGFTKQMTGFFGDLGRRFIGKAGLAGNSGLGAFGNFVSQSEAVASVGSKEMAEYMLLMNALLGKDFQAAKEFIQDVNKFLNNFGNGNMNAYFERVAFSMNLKFEQVSAAQVRSGGENGDRRVDVAAAGNQVTENGETKAVDPLVFDLDGDGIELTPVEDGVLFDMLGNGTPVLTSFVDDEDAFLALDADGNGTIDSGRELFGTQNGAENGFEELRKYDTNADGFIDAEDDVFADLRLWNDRNLDGVSQVRELVPLAEHDISSIDLGYEDRLAPASGGNKIAQHSFYETNDYRRWYASDVLLNYMDLFG